MLFISVDGEYNRLLQIDPLIPRNSALPAEALWNGAAQFWLFERVYCTKEALDNEYCATNELGWATGKIYKELQSREILVPIDWKKDIDEATASILRYRHTELRAKETEQHIRSLIHSGDVIALEAIKLRLIEPITTKLRCFQTISPNSLKTWVAPKQTMESRKEIVHKFVSSLAAPLGLHICDPPGTGVSHKDKERQDNIQKTVEAPMIPDLLSGEGRFGGEKGYEPYIRELAKHIDDYKAINTQLTFNWEENKHKLYKLRTIAKEHLWPQLHGEWLPRLNEEGEKFAKEFARKISLALMLAPLANFLTIPTNYVFAVSLSTSQAAFELLSELAGVGGGAKHLMALVGGGIGGAATSYLYSQVSKKVGRLALFYQKARKSVR